MMKENNNRITIVLYYDNHFYETEEIKISISPEKVYLTEYTYEHAPGGSYGLTHVLDEENSKRFIALIMSEGTDIEDTVKKKFSGPEGAEKFKAFCKTHNIKCHC